MAATLVIAIGRVSPRARKYASQLKPRWLAAAARP